MRTTTLVAAATLIALTAGTAANAAPRYHHGHSHYGKVTAQERYAIKRSSAKLATLKRKVYRDGRVTIFEKVQLRIAQSRHNALVARAKRS